jgi:hypothetical protein
MHGPSKKRRSSMPHKDTQLTKQAGEYLVAAELARRGCVAATFSGNMRHYDIVVSGPKGGHIPVQVKALASGDWQLKITDFAEVTMESEKQLIRAAKPAPVKDLIFVFVAVRSYGTDGFFIVDWPTLRDQLLDGYRDDLKKHGGRRPRNSGSFHTAVSVKSLAKFKDRWDLITDRLEHERSGT